MWSSHAETLLPGRVLKFSLLQADSPVTYSHLLEHWRNDRDFCSWFSQLLAASPFPAFRWETPAITTATVNRPFEFVLVNDPGLERPAEIHPFAEHFSSGDSTHAVEFPNLRGDAILVVPTPAPDTPHSAYCHLAAFLRHAPQLQIHALWQQVGAAMHRRLGSKPVWLSTAGAGVPWLHVRLDDQPKYYSYGPYRALP